MDHLSIKDILSYMRGEVTEDQMLDIESHIADCDKCAKRVYLYNIIKENINEVWEILRMEKQAMAAPLIEKIKVFLKEIIEQIKIPQRKYVFQGAAVAMGLLLCFTIYKTFIERPHEVEKIHRDLKITLTEANPVIIETMDIEVSLEKIKDLIKAHEGNVINILYTNKGIQVTFRLRREKEPALFDDLKKLGEVHIEKEGYKNKEGNIIVLLVKKEGN